MPKHATRLEETGQDLDDVNVGEPAVDLDGQRLEGELDDAPHGEPSVLVGPMLDKAVDPKT